LDEGTGQGLHLPRRRRLAGAKTDDGVADLHRLAGLQGQRTGNAVALVEQAQHRHALGHRSRPGGDRGDRLGDVDRARLGRRLAVGGRLLLGAPAAAGRNGQSEENGAERGFHAWSGVHAS
jgi:hypothetical protein